MEIFASAATIKRRALEMLLAFGVGLGGLVATFAVNLRAFPIAAGVIGGLIVGFLGRRFWPMDGPAPDRREWTRFLGVLIIPCGIVLGAGLFFAIGKNDLAGSYFVSFAIGLLVSAVLDLKAIGKRASE